MACTMLLQLILRCIPTRLRGYGYEKIAQIYSRRNPYSDAHHLPFGLLLKCSRNVNEALALKLAESIRGVNTQHLIDYVAGRKRTFILTTWVAGESSASVWDQLTDSDKRRISVELRMQITRMREQTRCGSTLICSPSNTPIIDPRVPWLSEDPQVFQSPKEFYEQVWPGLDFPYLSSTLAPLVRPVMDRTDVPVVFCHGDILPKNIILPGGLERWRTGNVAIYLIDWEYAGWMPLSWEALKATWIVCDRDGDDWYEMMQNVFPESAAELEADWEWRTKSGIPIV